ncbi:MAG: ATP-binding protein [candidate division Zixibacteria bacterium]|nr:ATP-binding protein [candidate division Zixibacteria bacterium]MDD5425536.1 ATP-binding protein [candidate division Zixibacteria bacterium]
MSIAISHKKAEPVLDFTPFDEAHYRELKRKHIVRLLLTYLTPLILLSIYFYVQYGLIVSEGRRLHLTAVAENQANTLDLFLSERLVNLSNLIDDPKLEIPPSSAKMQNYLDHLIRNSETFVDVGYFDSAGVQAAYAGPYPSLEKRNYSSESWFQSLKAKDSNFVITDIYLGFRQRPHFTIAVSRILNNQLIVIRATLDPEKIYKYITSQHETGEVYTSIVNQAGYYQLVSEQIGKPLTTSSFVPPHTPLMGSAEVKIGGTSVTYAYSWLQKADWALIVQLPVSGGFEFLSGGRLQVIIFSAVMIFLIFLIIMNRAQKLVKLQIETDRARAQLEHAAKLASVGELAAGIAHEINNPLAVISEESGLIKDLMNPEFGEVLKPDELVSHLDTIQESVFRCRDITRKLLGFVRKSDIDLKPHDINRLIDGVMDGFLSKEMAVENIEVIRRYDRNIPRLITDSNQLQQVLLNIINNAVDAISGRAGQITITTSLDESFVYIAVTDDGTGMTPEQIKKIFLPFFSTKEVGKGTGLGLSVSYGIIKNLGGRIEVNSKPGEGSTFTIILPLKKDPGKV